MDIKIRQAVKSDIFTLKKLWQICFNDRMRYIDVFFENMFKEENTIVAEVNNKLAGVVYTLELTLSKKKFVYGYAIGVFPEFRGNSICELMLNYIKEQCKKKDAIFGLHPANDKLTEFYKKIGLSEMYSLKIVDATDFKSEKAYSFTDISAEEFFKMRSETFKNCVNWDKKSLEYILKNGENVKKIEIEGKQRYIVISKVNETLTIKETTLTDEEILMVSEYIKNTFNGERIIYLLPNTSRLDGKIKPMILGFSEKNESVYMNLFLD